MQTKGKVLQKVRDDLLPPLIDVHIYDLFITHLVFPRRRSWKEVDLRTYHVFLDLRRKDKFSSNVLALG